MLDEQISRQSVRLATSHWSNISKCVTFVACTRYMLVTLKTNVGIARRNGEIKV